MSPSRGTLTSRAASLPSVLRSSQSKSLCPSTSGAERSTARTRSRSVPGVTPRRSADADVLVGIRPAVAIAGPSVTHLADLSEVEVEMNSPPVLGWLRGPGGTGSRDNAT